MAYQNPDGTYFNEVFAPPVVVLAPNSGDVVPVRAGTRGLYVNPAAGLAALTVRLPGGIEKFTLFEIGFGQGVTALTIQDFYGNAVAGAPAAGSANTSIELRFLPLTPGATPTWVKWR